MAWGDGAAALTDRFAAARALWNDQATATTYQGFIKALGQAGLSLMTGAADSLRRRIQQLAGGHHRRFGFIVLAADGSRFDLPRTAENEQSFGTAGKDKSPPQLWITTLWHMGPGLPWDWRIGGARSSERDHLRTMLDDAPPGALIVADAGFTGYELINHIVASGRDVLIRVGRGVELLQELGHAEHVDEQTVWLWPSFAQRDRRPPLVLRLIRVQANAKQPMYLLSSVRDRQRLSDEQAATLYRMRWGAELCYRSLKQTLERRKLRSGRPATALFEMHGLMLGLTLLGLMSVQAIVAAGHDPLSWSLAASLRAVRRVLRRPRQRINWLAKLSGALKDGYRRRRKTRRPWPRKKQHDPPPGRPRLRRATPGEANLWLNLQSQ